MSVVHGSFTLRREYPAPVATVFNAFADTAAKAKWFAGPEGWREIIREMDFRPGGQERAKGRFPSGHESDFHCEYRDIVPNERIVYVYDMYRERHEDLRLARDRDVRESGQGHEAHHHRAGRIPRRL